LSTDGNLLVQEFKRAQRIQFASFSKRDYDARILAKSVVEEALTRRTPIALEQLDFPKPKGSKSKSYRKFNRMKSNFLYRKICEAIISRAARMGVEILFIQPAFTSVLGSLHYKPMYSLNRHTAAAIILGRRALGFLEKQDFTVTEIKKEKKSRKTKKDKSVTSEKTVTLKNASGKRLNLEGRGFFLTLSLKAYSWLMRGNFLKPKNSYPHRVATGSQEFQRKLNLGIGGSLGEIPKSEPIPITGRDRQLLSPGTDLQGAEMTPEEKFLQLL
jgi:IS605 OrfB family transposase